MSAGEHLQEKRLIMTEQIKVAILEQKLEDVKDIIVKLDSAIEKLSEVNSNVSKMLAVHEERIAKQEETDTILFTKIDKLRDKVDRDYDRVVSRVHAIEKRVWMAIGAIACITFLMNTKIINVLTPPAQGSIMEHTNFKE
jgi:chromosome segregation ATPase